MAGKLLLLVMFLILVFALKPASPQVQEKITVGNVKEYSIFNLIAKENGYFKRYGLDAEIKEYDSGPAAIRDLENGSLNYALASDNAGVQAIFRNGDIRLVSQFVKNDVFSVVYRTESGIETEKDLIGKRIGVTNGSAGEYLFSQFLSLQKIPETKIEILNLSPTQIKSAIVEGTIDGGVLFEPNVFDLLKQVGGDVRAIPLSQGFYTYGLIYSTNTYLSEHSGSSEKYIKALADAEKYVSTHPKETKNLMREKLSYSDEYIDYSWSKNYHELAFNQELLLSMETIAKWVIEQKLTDKKTVPNYLEYIYFDSLEKVKPGSVKIVH